MGKQIEYYDELIRELNLNRKLASLYMDISKDLMEENTQLKQELKHLEENKQPRPPHLKVISIMGKSMNQIIK